MAFFKRKATPEEFGQAITHLVKGPLSSDALRSLGTRFDDFDASSGWSVFLERKGRVPARSESLLCPSYPLRHSSRLHSIRRSDEARHSVRRNDR